MPRSILDEFMGTMLKSTDNNVKNMEINQTVGIAIDDNWWCIVSTIFFFPGVGAAIFLAPESGGLSFYIGYIIIMDILGERTELGSFHACFGG